MRVDAVVIGRTYCYLILPLLLPLPLSKLEWIDFDALITNGGAAAILVLCISKPLTIVPYSGGASVH